MRTIRVYNHEAETKLVVKPNLRWRLFLSGFCCFWLVVWSFGTLESLRSEPGSGIFFYLDIFDKILFSALWIIGLFTFIYVSTYREEFSIRPDVVKKYFCVLFKYPITGFRRTPATILRVTDGLGSSASVYLETEKETLELFSGTQEQACRLFGELTRYLPGLKSQSSTASFEIQT